MKNKLTFIRPYAQRTLNIIVCVACFCISLEAQYHNDPERFSFTYDDCSGAIEFRFKVMDLEACLFADRLHSLNISAVKPGGFEKFIFHFKDGMVDASYPNAYTAVCRSLGFDYDVDYAYGILLQDPFQYGTFETERIGGSSAERGYYMIFKYYGLPNEQFGTRTKIKVSGFWSYDNADTNGEFFTNVIKEDTKIQAAAEKPDGLTATKGEFCDYVQLAWGNTSIACLEPDFDTRYKTEIYRRVKDIGNFAMIAAVGYDGDSYQDHPSDLREYDYKIRHVYSPSVHRSSESDFTSLATGHRKFAPTAPTINTISHDSTDTANLQCDKSVHLAWTAGTNETQTYKIFREGVHIKSFAGDVFSYSDPIPVSLHFKDLNYELSAIDQCSNESPRSAVKIGYVEGDPSTPTSVLADTSAGKILVTWVDNSSYERGYVVERLGAGESVPVRFGIPANTTTFLDPDPQQCVQYTYTVKIVTHCAPDGVGMESAQGIIGPDLSTAFAQDETGFEASKGYHSNQILLTWENGKKRETTQAIISRRVLGSGQPFVQIDSKDDDSGIYNDYNVEAGILYEYELYAVGDCMGTAIATNRVSAIGFRTKTSTINGAITYTGGIAVQGVKVIAERDQFISSHSLALNGGSLTVVHHVNQQLSNQWIAEAWVKPTNHSAYDLINKPGSYRIYSDGLGSYKAEITYDGSNQKSVSTSTSSVAVNQWNHLVAQVRNDSLFLYVDGLVKDSVSLSMSVSISNATTA